jgi:hypothetical protein
LSNPIAARRSITRRILSVGPAYQSSSGDIIRRTRSARYRQLIHEILQVHHQAIEILPIRQLVS